MRQKFFSTSIITLILNLQERRLRVLRLPWIDQAFFCLSKVLESERPDGVLLTFGGQTALNCGVELERDGVFRKYNVRILGTPIQSIIDSEDRKIFAERVAEIGEQVAPSVIVENIDDALR